MSRAYVFNFERLDILCAGIGEPSKKLWPFEFLESFHGSFSSVSKYHGPHTYTRVKSYGCLNFLRSSVYNFESLNILWAWIGHPSEKLLPFEFVESFHCSFSSVSIYHRPHTYTRVKCYGRLNIMRAYMFNFRRLDILGAGMGVRVKSYDHLNFSRAFVVHFRVCRFIMGLNHIPESKVMAVWICLALPCLTLSVSIYYAPKSEIRVKCYDHLNFSKASIVRFKASWYIMGVTHIPES